MIWQPFHAIQFADGAGDRCLSSGCLCLGCGVIDNVSARATLADGATSITLEFRFGTDGLIAQVWARVPSPIGERVRAVVVPGQRL